MQTSTVITLAASTSALAAIMNLAVALTLARISRRNAIGNVFTWAADLLSSDDVVQARAAVFSGLRENRTADGKRKEMDESLKRSFEKACRTYDLVGIAGHNKMLPHNIIAAEWGNSIIRLYELCEPYIKDLREDRGPKFWNNFSQLYAESLQIWEPSAPRKENSSA